MTRLAHDAVMLDIPFDSSRLFDSDDDGYDLWLQSLVDRVAATRREQERRSR